ncbi:MAG: hypothetical protein N2442_06625 [Spirochaetes bacterium]|nr:hypothetical protein [Spirochaetota bacterium]
MSEGYFHRVHANTPTRFWVNNPTCSEAKKSIEAGAICCTTNPSYVMKIHQSSEEKARIEADVREAVKRFSSDEEAAAYVQRKAVQRIAEIFHPLYEKTQGSFGWVSIQISPFEEEDPQKIIQDAEENIKLGKNIIAKIPTTDAGLKAIEVLAKKGTPIIATEIMALSQAVAVCELYQTLPNPTPPLFVTHITGIFDEYLQKVVKERKIPVDSDSLFQAGCVLARHQYWVMKERRYPGILLGGGARGLHHFTEMVGGDMHVTINWQGTAEVLIQQNPPVVPRFHTPLSSSLISKLTKAIPEFKAAFLEDGLERHQFADFGPVVLFRSMFEKGWKYLLDLVTLERNKR